jgi:hypothetical protein
MAGETALDRMWDRLDIYTDALLDHEGPRRLQYMENKARAEATALCIAEFYGGDVDRIRLLAMGRRAIRERSRAEAAGRDRGRIRAAAQGAR